MSKTSNFFKSFVVLLNILNVLLGLLVFALSIKLYHRDYLPYVISLFVIGCLLIALSLIGCFAVCRSNVCWITTYGIIMLATLFFVLIIGYLEKNIKVESFQDDEIDEAWQLEFSRPANEGHMDAVQMKYNCCGVKGYNDYYSIGRNQLPKSCYPNKNERVPFNAIGCLTAVTNEIQQTRTYLKRVFWGTYIIMPLLCLCAFCLALRFRKERQRNMYRY